MSDPLILLVEDTQVDVLLTQRALRKSLIKAELLVASDGEEARQFIETEDDIALILLDLHLPKVNGLHFLEQLRHNRSVPVVVVTSSELASDRSKAMELGADRYIAKPIDPTKLKQVIDELEIEALKPAGGDQDG